MKRIAIVMVTVVLALGIHGRAWGSVANSKHDMYFMGKGTDPNVCSYCHVPHKAVGDKIWSAWANEAQLTSGPSSLIGNMCYTCHDGTATNIGQTTAFNSALQQHKTGSGTDCNICHTVHDNTNGKFFGTPSTQSASTESATYCETCHDSTMYTGATALGDHIGGVEHPYKDAGSVLDASCNSCHQVHGAANYTTASLTNPILKQNNTDSAYCATCHSGKIQATTNGNKHPAILTAAGTWGKVACSTCHDAHQPSVSAGTRVSILTAANQDSAMCTTCHPNSDSSGVNGPGVGAKMHPVGDSFTTIGLTPSANAIDDNNNGADYPGNSSQIVCESCHSIHGKGVAGKALRITAVAGALCKNCHSNK